MFFKPNDIEKQKKMRHQSQHTQKKHVEDEERAPNLVAAVEDVDHTLRVRVSLVASVRGAVVDHGLVDGVGGLVGEDARRQARHQLDDLVNPAALHDVVVDEDVLAEELHLVLEVAEQPSHLMCQKKQLRF